ncbi:MAG: hypothetical protein HRT53_21065 [Colwellia sp.]|nr:hypothetical protein [Colwellia sp.]
MNTNCEIIHSYCNRIKRYNFPFDSKELPKNGIYILFEKSELGHELDRIVRVGTHTGINQLIPRLKQHFLSKNKDRSIFRKNIGRAMLNEENDEFIAQWNIDLTTREARKVHEGKINKEYQDLIEEKVSNYIQDNFTFAILPVEEKEDRLMFEARLISSISLCKNCGPSKDWLGNSSPKVKIVESGLWQVNELYKKGIDDRELALLLPQLSE